MRLLLIFVEGEHDVVWTERSLRIHQQYEEFGRVVHDYPTPLGGPPGQGVLARQLVHALDQHLATAKRPPLPRLEAALHHAGDDTLALVMQMKGVAQFGQASKLARSWRRTRRSPRGEPRGYFSKGPHPRASCVPRNSHEPRTGGASYRVAPGFTPGRETGTIAKARASFDAWPAV